MIEEEDEIEVEKKEEVIELDLSEDDFEVFDQPQSFESPFGDLGVPICTEADFLSLKAPFEEDMGIQRKQKMSLLDLIESQPEKETQARATQNKPPSPSQSRLCPAPSKLPPPSPKLTLPPRTEPFDPKRKRESKGKEVIEAKKSCLTPKEEAQRAAKQQKVGHKGPKKRVESLPKTQAWLPAPMLNEAPLMDNASIRDFQGGTSSHVADALERTLLLPSNMAELRSFRRQEVFLSLKRYLGMVRFPIHSI